MAIKQIILGNSPPAAERELFGLIGRWLIDKDIQAQLGVAVTADDGDIWYLATDGKGCPRGFATARVMKNDRMHLRFLYCVPDADLVCRTLINRCIKDAKSHGCAAIWSNDRETATIWPSLGFTATPKARGAFVRWALDLETNDD